MCGLKGVVGVRDGRDRCGCLNKSVLDETHLQCFLSQWATGVTTNQLKCWVRKFREERNLAAMVN